MTCEVKILEMQSLKDNDYWTKQDPFIVVEYGGNKHTTPVKNEGGKNPKWSNQKFTYKISSLSEDVIITATDSDPFNNDLIGKTSIKASKLCPTGTKTHGIDIKDKAGKKSGTVYFTTKRV